MTEKNRFSKLLEYLMSVTELKNATLAQELQYDVSYISKWISGRMLPAEKTEKKVLEGISKCIVESADEEARNNLLSDYQVDDCEELKMAIFDNLEAEYSYVRDLQKNTGLDVAPKTFYYPELTMAQYVSKMRHPVLRRVQSLDIMAAIDLMAMGHEYQLQITQVENVHVPKMRGYPDVRYSMLIHVQPEKWDYIYDTIFLIHLLTCNTYISFNLYGDEQAAGRVIFTVKDDYAISGMLVSADRCMAVNVSEEYENCRPLYRNIKALCNKERLLFRRTTIKEMIEKHNYIHSLLSLNQRWLIGHMTEHFLSDELFEEILEQLSKSGELMVEPDELRSIHRLIRNIMKESHIKFLIYKAAFYNLVVTNELDFYNHKVCLTAEQRSRYLEYILSLCREQENLEIRLISGRFVADFEYSDSQCIFLSDTISHLRLEGEKNNMVIINRSDMRKIFEESFEAFWNYNEEVVESDRMIIEAYIQHVIRGIYLVQ
ncbi:MAG: hypothetical protein ACI4EO_06905 [Blautia sp.]